MMQLTHFKVAQLKPESFRPEVRLSWTTSTEVKANSKLMPSAPSPEQGFFLMGVLLWLFLMGLLLELILFGQEDERIFS